MDGKEAIQLVVKKIITIQKELDYYDKLLNSIMCKISQGVHEFPDLDKIRVIVEDNYHFKTHEINKHKPRKQQNAKGVVLAWVKNQLAGIEINKEFCIKELAAKANFSLDSVSRYFYMLQSIGICKKTRIPYTWVKISDEAQHSLKITSKVCLEGAS